MNKLLHVSSRFIANDALLPLISLEFTRLVLRFREFCHSSLHGWR